MRVHVAVSVALALVVSAVATTLAAVPASATASRTSNDFQYDEARAAELIADGYSEPAALLLAGTEVGGRAIGDHRARITEAFPTGNHATIDVSITPTHRTEPSTPTVEARTKGGSFIFSLEYVVPSDAIPLAAQPTASPASAGGPIAPASLAVYSPALVVSDGGFSGFLVVLKGAVTKFGTGKVAGFVKTLDAKLAERDGAVGTAGKIGGLGLALKAGLSAAGTISLTSEINALLRRIDALEKCAKNPTNPLTKKAYKENPAELDRILKQVDDTRKQVTNNAGVTFVGNAAKESTSLRYFKGAPWLGYVVGAGVGWSKDTLRKVNQGLVDDLAKAIVPCTRDYKVDGVAFGQRWVATKCDGVAGEWDVAITSDARRPAAGSFLFKTEPDEGQSVAGVTNEIEFRDSRYEGQGYSETFFMTFHAGVNGGASTLGIDEQIGGAVLPVKAGNFCK